MFAHERRNAISELVAKKKRATVGSLQKALRISPATLRRDLAEMEKSGSILRVHGGVVHPQSIQREASFRRKCQEEVEAKRKIARAASELVPDGSSVFLDSGTTCLEIGRQLLSRSSLILITNSVPLLLDAYGADASIISTGGELRTLSGALTGAVALNWMEHLQADWAFLGASGMDAQSVATTELSEASIKRQFLCNARHRVLAADGTKWNRSAPVRFAGWADFEWWLTSTTFPAAKLKTLQTMDVNVVRCKC